MTAGQASLQREVEATARAAAELAAVSLVAGGEEGQQEESSGVDPLDSWSPEPDNLPVQLSCQQLCIVLVTVTAQNPEDLEPKISIKEELHISKPTAAVEKPPAAGPMTKLFAGAVSSLSRPALFSHSTVYCRLTS